jgi:hypothetical protein
MKLVTYLYYDDIKQPGILDAETVLPLMQAGSDDLLSLIAGGD